MTSRKRALAALALVAVLSACGSAGTTSGSGTTSASASTSHGSPSTGTTSSGDGSPSGASTSPSGQTSVPDVDSDPLPEAIQLLQQDGLTAGAQEQRSNLYVPDKSVITTDPAVGSPEPDGFAVTLLISAGPPYCQNCETRPGPMPSVLGQTYNQAVTTLAKDGLSVEGSTDQASSDPAGQVIGSDPSPGSPVYLQTSIELTLSSGSAPPAGSPSPDVGPSGS
jgi:hypothetical protein